MDAGPLAQLTPAARPRWRVEYLDRAGTDPCKRDSAAVSINRALRCAKAHFSKMLRQEPVQASPLQPSPAQTRPHRLRQSRRLLSPRGQSNRARPPSRSVRGLFRSLSTRQPLPAPQCWPSRVGASHIGVDRVYRLTLARSPSLRDAATRCDESQILQGLGFGRSVHRAWGCGEKR